MEIPVYLFAGFLESGKTKFIQETLEEKKFHNKERTLVVVCEEGVEEYDSSKIPCKDVFFEVIEEKEELTEERLAAAAKKARATRVLVEYNGMWQLQELYDAMPEEWLIYQQMSFFDAATFENYNANIRSLVVDKITDADMVVFNRLPIGADQMIVRCAGSETKIPYK